MYLVLKIRDMAERERDNLEGELFLFFVTSINIKNMCIKVKKQEIKKCLNLWHGKFSYGHAKQKLIFSN